MAGDWIKMDVGLPEKPEVWQIAGMVGLDADSVVGKLLRVWRWFDAHTESGNAVGVTYSLVDHVAGVTGFAEAMALCGWLAQDGSTLSLPNFERHNGKTAKNRALTAKRVALCKSKSNAPIVTDALPREEKNREEKKEQKQEQSPAPAKPKKARGAEVTLAQWTEALAGLDAIPADDAVFAWAAKVRLPDGWVALAWWAFEGRYLEADKTYIDWRAVFRKALAEDWLKLWRKDQRTGDWVLTTAGEQARLEMQS